MLDYDFSALNDKEFEILCVDLLSAHEGRRFERFKPGRDGGVDGRFFTFNGKEVVLQCKHWINAPIERLIAYLANKERSKVDALRPLRYILVVSHALSRRDKSEIKKALHPHIDAENDIFGREDINSLLSAQPAIERKHFKLWIRSSTVLEYFLNKGTFDRSEALGREAQRKSTMYVRTASHQSAFDKLEQLRCVIIKGEPGIGKTTLAQQLALDYATQGFQLIDIGDDIAEAEAVFSVEESQLFYFDDFLGRNYLEALTGHEGSKIVKFIKRSCALPNKRTILTSRSTVLAQAKVLIDSFEHAKTYKNEYELTVSLLSEIDKARILYNHIWFSALPASYIEEIYSTRRYRRLIGHRNFNPRLIEFLTDIDRLATITAENYWQYIVDSLEDPTDIWANPFEAQLDDRGRWLVLLVTLNGGAISQPELAEAYDRCTKEAQTALGAGSGDFLKNIRQLTGSLLNRTVFDHSGGERVHLGLFNPSIGDYVLKRYGSDLPALRLGFLSLRSGEAVRTLQSLAEGGLVTEDFYGEMLDDILRRAAESGFASYEVEVIGRVARLLIDMRGQGARGLEHLKQAVRFAVTEKVPLKFEDVGRVLAWASVAGYVGDADVVAFIEGASVLAPSAEEIQVLSDLMQKLVERGATDLEEAISALRSAITEYYEGELFANEVDWGEIFSGLDERDIHAAQRSFKELLEADIEQRGLGVWVEDIDDIAERYDLTAEYREYVKARNGSSQGQVRAGTVMPDEIDDLFDRG